MQTTTTISKSNSGSAKQALKATIIIMVLFMISFSISATSMIRIKMNGLTNSLDETVVYYQDGATNDFDPDFDSYKLFGPNPAPHISQEYNSTLMAINGINPVAQTFSINIRATTHISGNFTITATDFAGLPKGTCVYLKDLITGTTVDILTNPYAFTLSNTTTTSRFVLSITHYELPAVSTVLQPACLAVNGGKIKVTPAGNAPWNYIWKDSLGTVVKTSLNSNTSDSLVNLSSGNYTVEVSSLSDQCYYKESAFQINEVIAPVAAFISPDTITASIMENYIPENQSLNGVQYTWNFGDGTASSEFEPAHSYSSQGVYQAKLVTTSITGCKDSTLKSVKVMDLTTSLIVALKQQIKLIDQGNNTYILKTGHSSVNELSIDVIDMTGRSVLSEDKKNVSDNDIIQLDLSSFTTGMYVVNISHKDKSIICSKVLVK